MNDILKGIEDYMIANDITKYRLCKLTGMNISSLYKVFSRKSQPELKTIQRFFGCV
ncbi:hypothetical protein ABN199_06310 [Klebsiella pneumoniae]|uniref:hypothetical protein n=1 Tax=Klebsiella pneumoniae TaxID=573 RepID=UPI00164B3312|nr:hypothetical protein [Klebsiella pneumoniae]MBC4942534.1 hypothetical protein [Klebsiella pneumoniae]MDP1487380.1 hypothetical protein [Klebsiella pneumoniae]MDT9814999.1 hypothetical protein [Klebsiella pneumoniae]MDZ0240249.1 helix-turn-helix transcriptional regulator [Klebsiella pneumoniae]MDZ0251196.1 helix-turn-helix transcriptional regulator [Klebsiella pneumoniae]